MSELPGPYICISCGPKFGRLDPTNISIGTFHPGKCSWCGQVASVTDPSDYGHPKPPERVEK